MAVEFRCADVGIVCKNVATAPDAQALVAAVAAHAEKVHGVTLNQTLIDYAVTKVRPASG